MSAYTVDLLVNAGINIILGLGFYTSILSGQLSVAHGALMGIGAYTAAILTVKLGWPFWPAILAGGVLAAVAGAAIAAVSLRLRGVYLAVATLAFGEALVVFLLNNSYVGGAAGFYGIPLITNLRHVALVVTLLVLFMWRFDSSRLAMAYRAVRDDEISAATMGINVRRTKVHAFTLGAFIVGVGGGLFAHYLGILEPGQFGYLRSITIMMFAAIGGVNAFLGPVFGAVLLTLAPEFLRVSGQDRYILYGILLVLVMIFRPNGLLERRSGRRPGAEKVSAGQTVSS